jgi:short subunit fatty acids transporter
MGLSATVASAVASAFTAIDDLKETVTFVDVAAGGYNSATDTFGDTETEYAVQAPVLAPTERELSWFPATDAITRKIIFKATDIVLPALKDQVEIGGVRFEVMRVKSVPGSSVYIVWVQGV